jgi:hypothetical protein
VLEPDDGKPSSPVLRGLGASNGARPLHSNPDGQRAISTGKSASVELSMMLGSVRCIQTLLAVPKSASGKLQTPVTLPRFWSDHGVLSGVSKVRTKTHGLIRANSSYFSFELSVACGHQTENPLIRQWFYSLRGCFGLLIAAGAAGFRGQQCNQGGNPARRTGRGRCVTRPNRFIRTG